MTQKETPPINWENIINGFLQRLEIPSKQDIDMINSRLDRIEKLIGRKISDPEHTDQSKRSEVASDVVLEVLSGKPNGVDFKTIKAETGYNDKKLRNIIFRLDRTGKIKRIQRGIYQKL
ncbi:MAG: hypothetical protein R6V54_13570 [Desulfobacteraceae bacterium]